MKYLLKSWLLIVQSPVQSFDYRANSYHIHLNTLEFHGYSKEISQKYPRSLYPINTSFLSSPSPPCHSSSPKLISLAVVLTKSSRTSTKPPQKSFRSLILSSSGRNGRQLQGPEGKSILIFFFLYCNLLLFISLLT